MEVIILAYFAAGFVGQVAVVVMRFRPIMLFVDAVMRSWVETRHPGLRDVLLPMPA